MGIFNRMIDFVTGGSAEVDVEIRNANLTEPFKVTVKADIGSEDIQCEKVYLLIRCQKIEKENYQAADESNMTDNEIILQESADWITETTYKSEIQVAPSMKLERGKSYEWDVQVDISAHDTPSETTPTRRIKWQVQGGIDVPGNDPDSAAFYFPAAPVKGQVDISYTLEITVDGNTVTAQDLMPPVAPVDSMLALIDPEEQADPAEEGEFYEVLVFTTEPQDRKDFYMFRFYKNFQRTRQSPEDIYIADDLVLGEKISGVPIPFYFAERDTATIEMYGISQEAFVYYTDLQAVMNSDGGLFSPPPANPRTNLQGGVLGFFLVASIQSDTLVIE